MNIKLFEVRDRGTFIPVMAIKLQPENDQHQYLLSTSGFGESAEQQGKYVMLLPLTGGSGKRATDHYAFARPGRTMKEAHDHIIFNFDDLEDGAVIDVEFILEEVDQPKQSQRLDGDHYA
jgi:hypothetical protein